MLNRKYLTLIHKPLRTIRKLEPRRVNQQQAANKCQDKNNQKRFSKRKAAPIHAVFGIN